MINSLQDLTSQKVAEYIHNGDYNETAYILDTKTSNKVFSRLLELNNGISENLLKLIDGKLNLSKINLQGVSVNRKIVNMVNKYCLESLILGSSNLNEGPSNDIFQACVVDMASLLKNLLNEGSLLNLRHLSIRTNQKFLSEWTQEISCLLPNLQSLSIKNRQFFCDESFSEHCQNFSNLLFLDISGTNLENLWGISHLNHLQVLHMRNLKFENNNCLMELFNLKDLRVLDISRDWDILNTQIIEQYLECGMVLPKLKFLDCSGTDICQYFLDNLLNTHDNLKQIVTWNTHLEDAVKAGIELLNGSTITTTINSLVHYMNLKRKAPIGWCLEVISNFLEINENEQFNVSECINHISRAMGIEKSLESRHNGIKCLTQISLHHYKKLRSFEIFRLLDYLLNYCNELQHYSPEINEHFWTSIINLISLGACQFDYDKICLTVLKYLTKSKHFHGSITSTCSILTVLIPAMSRKSMISITNEKENSTQIVEILKLGLDLKCAPWCISALGVLQLFSLINHDACRNIISVGGIDILFKCLKLAVKDIQTLAINVLTNIAILLKYDEIREIFTDENSRTIKQMLNKFDVSRSMHVISLLTLILSRENGGNGPIHCRLWSCSSLLTVDCFTDFLTGYYKIHYTKYRELSDPTSVPVFPTLCSLSVSLHFPYVCFSDSQIHNVQVTYPRAFEFNCNSFMLFSVTFASYLLKTYPSTPKPTGLSVLNIINNNELPTISETD